MGKDSRFKAEPKGRLPWEMGPEDRAPEPISRTTREKLDMTLKKAPVPAAKRLDMTLAKYLKDLESSGEQNNIEKARKIRMATMFAARYVKVDLGKIHVKKLPGLAIGEAKGDHIEVDPVLFNNKTYTADQLTKLKHVLLHELAHMEKHIDNEGLAEIFGADLSMDRIRDYSGLVTNVSQVLGVLSDDMESNILDAVDLYSKGKYDKLYEKFEIAYNAKYPDKAAENPDAALNVFQLAFPELKLDTRGEFSEDKEAIDEAF